MTPCPWWPRKRAASPHDPGPADPVSGLRSQPAEGRGQVPHPLGKQAGDPLRFLPAPGKVAQTEDWQHGGPGTLPAEGLTGWFREEVPSADRACI